MRFTVNNSVSESTNYTPLYLNYGEIPMSPAETELSKPRSQRNAGALAKEALGEAQNRHKLYADKMRSDLAFEVGQNHIGLKQKGTLKFTPQWLGLCKVLQRIGPAAYQLQLPPNMEIHDVFHVSLLKDYRLSGRVQPPPLPTVESDLGMYYEVEAILASQPRKKRSLKYLRKWKGDGPKHNM
eukprot:jgi/Chlat1/1036/Chrsp109S01468